MKSKALRVCHVVNHINRAQQFEWMAESADPQKLRLSFVFLNDGPSVTASELKKKGFPVLVLRYRRKRDVPRCVFQLAFHWLFHRPDVVHGHLFIGTLVAFLAALLLFIRPRIYTRHYSTLHHDYHPHAVRRDLWLHRRAERIVAVSPAVARILMEREGVPPAKIFTLPHGLALDTFRDVKHEAIERLREKYNPRGREPVVGMVARFTHWKGVQDVLAAWPTIQESYPDALLLLANATGDYEHVLQPMLENLPAGSWQTIAFEPEVQALYQLFDIFVHVPIDAVCEAYGQTYVEASAAGIPMVCTLSGIASEFVHAGVQAEVVPYESPEAIVAAVLSLLSEPSYAQSLADSAQCEVFGRYTFPDYMQGLYTLYGI